MDIAASCPFPCTNKNVKHETDALKELHGSVEQPIPVGEKNVAKYVAWEYDEIGRIVGIYHRCLQQLLHDPEKKISVDRIVVRDIRGGHHVFYFDISVPINEDRALMEKAFEDFQAGRPIDPQRKALFEKAIELKNRRS